MARTMNAVCFASGPPRLLSIADLSEIIALKLVFPARKGEIGTLESRSVDCASERDQQSDALSEHD